MGFLSHTLPHLFHFYLRHKAEQRPWDGQSQSARLSRVTAALHTALDVKPAQHAHKVQRKQQLLPEREKEKSEKWGEAELRTCFSLLDCSSFQHLYEWHSCKSPIEDCIVIFRQSDNPATVRTIERTRCKRVQSLAGRPTVLTQSNTPLLLQLGLCEADGVIRAGSRPHADSAESPAHSSV